MRLTRLPLFLVFMFPLQSCGESSIQRDLAQQKAAQASFHSLLDRRDLINNKVSVLVPRAFKELDVENLRRKYPNENRPDIVLSNSDGTINLTFAHKPNRLRPDQLELALDSISTGFRKLYPSATWHREKIVKINSREFFIVELTHPSLDGDIHNIIAGTSLEGRFMLIGFNFTVEEGEEWASRGRTIVESIQIK